MNSWTSSCRSFMSLTWLPGEQECVPPRTQPKVDCSLGGRSPGWWASWPRPRRSWGRPRPGWGRPRPRPCRRTAKSSQSRAAGAGTVNPSNQVRSSDFIRFALGGRQKSRQIGEKIIDLPIGHVVTEKLFDYALPLGLWRLRTSLKWSVILRSLKKIRPLQPL